MLEGDTIDRKENLEPEMEGTTGDEEVHVSRLRAVARKVAFSGIDDSRPPVPNLEWPRCTLWQEAIGGKGDGRQGVLPGHGQPQAR